MKRITRRDALKLGAIADGSLLLPIGRQDIGRAKDDNSPLVTPDTLPFPYPQRLKPVRSDNTLGTDTSGDFSKTDY